MTRQSKYKTLLLIVLIEAIIFTNAVLLTGCKKEPEETTETQQPGSQLQQPQPAAEQPETPKISLTDLFPGPKISLSEVVRSARTWGPAFESWAGKVAPDFSLTDLEGNQHTLSDYDGKNVMIIFWATWWGPCRMEIPDLIELRNTVGQDKLAMLAISRESPALLRSFVAQQNVNYTILTQSDRLPKPYAEVNTIPCSFFIDPQGKIKLATVGLLPLSDIKAILQAK
jgi:peroxiredoxin